MDGQRLTNLQQSASKNCGTILKNVPQCKTAKSLKIPPSTIHNIIKRFIESGGVSVQRGQGQRSKLNLCDLQALRQHCIKNRHDFTGHHCMGSGTLPEITVCQHRFTVQFTNASYSCVMKRRNLVYDSDMLPSSLGQSLLKMV